MSIISFSNSTIHSFLTDKVYHIPDYQREYAWDEDQLEDFWKDLVNTTEERRQHFFGQVVVHQASDGKYYIIDGQQRTTSVVIFLAALRDWFQVFADEDDDARNKVEDIRIKYIGRFSNRSNELRLQLGVNDRSFFRDNIQKSAPKEEGSSPSQRRITTAYRYFTAELSDLLGKKADTGAKVGILLDYYDALLEQFSLIVVTTNDINEAFIIFETLNARGKELETADLLKNYVFMKSGANLDTVKDRWEKMIDTLDDRDDATIFIRYYWNSFNKFTREKNLYKEISSKITSYNCEALVSDLASMADLYNALTNPTDSKYFSDSEIADLLINLSIMNAATFYPVIFALVKTGYQEIDIKRVLKAIEILTFRNFVVAGLTANKYESIFSQIALRISKGEYQLIDILNQIRDNTVDDEKFARDLIGLEIRKVPIAKYVLREIEDFNNPEKKTIKDNKAINLEHIMPKNNAQWGVPNDIHAKYLYRLSNQTIMLEEYNKSASNKVFSQKKPYYLKSEIEMTKKLATYDTWDAVTIQSREDELIAVIKNRWALV